MDTTASPAAQPSSRTALRRRIRDRIFRSLAARLNLAPAGARLPRGAFSVTFDDFPKTAWQAGGAVLGSFGVTGTYYTAGILQGRYFSGLQQFDEADLVAAFASGHEIGCHTYDHFGAFSEPVAGYVASIARNGQFLRERLPGWVGRSFSYPYGQATLGARRAAASLYPVCRGTLRGLNGARLDRSLLRSTGLERWWDWRAEVAGLIEAAARERSWVVVHTHDVQERPSEFGCTPAELEWAVRHALNAGLDVRPVGEVFAAALEDVRRPAAARAAGAAAA